MQKSVNRSQKKLRQKREKKSKKSYENDVSTKVGPHRKGNKGHKKPIKRGPKVRQKKELTNETSGA